MMISLIVEGDNYVFPAESSVKRVCWDVNSEIPLATPQQLRRLQQRLHRPLPLEEISLFHVCRRSNDNDTTTNTILPSSSSSLLLLSSLLEKGDSNLYNNVWEPIDAALSPIQMGLKDGSVLFLSGDPFSLFASGCVRFAQTLSYDSNRLTEEKNTETSLKLLIKEEEQEQEEEYPFWIPLMHSLLRWKLYNAVSNNLLLCGTSERRVVKIGNNGWENSLVGLPFSLGEWMELKRISSINTTIPVCEGTLSWTVCLNAISKIHVQEIASALIVSTSHSRKVENLKDVIMTMDCNNNNIDIKTRQLLEVSKIVKQALYQAKRESLWSSETNVGTSLLTRVVFPSKTSLPSGDTNIPLSSSLKIVENVTEEVPKEEKEKKEKIMEVTENETEVSDHPYMLKVNKEEELWGCEEESTDILHDGHDKPNISNDSENKKNILLTTNTDNNNNTLMNKVEEDVRVPPCVLIGLASPIVIKEYLINTENTNKNSQKPLNGYFIEPYTGVFFVNGVPSQMLPKHQVVSALPALPATITMTVDIHLQVLNIIMNAEVVLVFPLSLCTLEEILELRPVVQIFSCGAVVDIH